MKKFQLVFSVIALLFGWYFFVEPSWNSPPPFNRYPYTVWGSFDTEAECNTVAEIFKDRLRTPMGNPQYDRFSKCFEKK